MVLYQRTDSQDPIHISITEMKQPKIKGGASAKQKGEASQLRSYVNENVGNGNACLFKELSHIVHSGDLNPNKSSKNPFADKENKYSKPAENVIIKGALNVADQKRMVKQNKKLPNKRNCPTGGNMSVLLGGKVSAKYVKDFLSSSYDKKPPERIGDFIQDKGLTGQRAQVYHNPKTGQAVVVHRGSASIQDWGNNLKLALGFNMKDTKRFSHAAKIQKQAEEKYGAKNVSTLGHSLGAKIASDVGKDSGEVITLNKPTVGRDLFKENQGKNENETNIRTDSDLVSKLSGNSDFTIPSKSLNPIAEHSPDVVDRVEGEFGKSEIGASGEEKLPTLKEKEPEKGIISKGIDAVKSGFNKARSWIGLGFSKEGIQKLNKKQLKEIIKAFPKTRDGFKLVGAGKPQLVEYICKRCGK